MSLTALLPRTAPFEGDDLASLNRVLGPATPLQRAWLSGFLAGVDSHAAEGAPALAGPPRAAEPLLVLYLTESGNSERLAGDIGKLAKKNGFKPRVADLADLELSQLPPAKNILVVAATWGEGEPPGRAAAAFAALMGASAPRLDGVRFGVLALGDTAYAEFCAIGKAIDARLEELGGTRAVERADLDLDFEAPASAWIRDAVARLAPEPVHDNVVAVDFGRSSAEPSREPVEAEVLDHVNLNSSRSDKETIHLALGFDRDVPAYEPGDTLELFAENDPALVDHVLAATGLTGDDALRQTLLAERDLTTLSASTIERFVNATGHGEARRLLESGDARAWIEGRQLVDLLETYPAKLAAQQLGEITRPLPPRAYSIASSRKEVGDEAHLLVSAVRYESHGRERAGVASVHVADRLRNGARLKVRLKPNRHFRLPGDPSRDIIMVGPGTGIAPFRAFVQERRAIGAGGRSWLFFGDRRFTHDFLYQLEWQEALEDGSLTRIDVAFSRDQPDKIYVQHRLRARARELVDWLEGGAHLYVCGDAKQMAKDVRAALVDAFANVKGLTSDAAAEAVSRLKREKRYLQDVY